MVSLYAEEYPRRCVAATLRRAENVLRRKACIVVRDTDVDEDREQEKKGGGGRGQ